MHDPTTPLRDAQRCAYGCAATRVRASCARTAAMWQQRLRTVRATTYCLQRRAARAARALITSAPHAAVACRRGVDADITTLRALLPSIFLSLSALLLHALLA